MKLNAGLPAVALLLMIGGCGQGNEERSSQNQPPPATPEQPESPWPFPPPPPGGTWGSDTYAVPTPVLGASCQAGAGRGNAHGGIWAVSAPAGASGEMRLLVAESGEFRWISVDGWDQQVFGTFRSVDSRLVSDDAIFAWWSGLMWLETDFTGVALSGDLDDDSNLLLEYEIDADPVSRGTVSFSACNSIYTRPSSLETLAGTYANDYKLLSISRAGEIYFQEGTCVSNGSVELIDPDYNMYRMELVVSNCDGAGVFSGLAYLADSGTGSSGDLLEYALTSISDDRVIYRVDRLKK